MGNDSRQQKMDAVTMMFPTKPQNLFFCHHLGIVKPDVTRMRGTMLVNGGG